MAAHVGDVMGKKVQKKHYKKMSKIKEQLERKENVIACEHPTTILCVQNGGLDNGVSQDDLHDIFSRFGQVQDIIMVPRKPFCFVCYDTAQSAAAARDQLTGYLLKEGKDPSQNITLYLFFVASAPSNVCPSKELPPGLLLLEDFITKETEQLLLENIDFKEHGSSDTGGSLKHRDVKHYGYEFKYGINNVDPNEPLPEGIPEQCHNFLQRALDMKIVGHFPDQLTVNRYLPGQGIPPHVDTPSAFEDGIMSLSCGSQVIMDFRHPDGRHLSVLVPMRSLLVMTGESRYVWSHGITPRKSDIVPSPTGGVTLAARGVRVSFTFRKLSPTAGILQPEQTDSGSCLPQTAEEAAALERQHVHQVYEEIADHFSDTRHKPWPQIAQFLMDQEPGSILVDIGCGNGKYFGVNTQLCQIGSDRSHNLASIVQSRGFQVFVGDVLAIPVRSASVDVGLCIAVIHHLSTKARRKQAIEELVRILTPGGCVLIYVWAQEQQKDNQKSTYLKPHRQHRKETRTQAASPQSMGSVPEAVAETSSEEGSHHTESVHPCERDSVGSEQPETVSGGNCSAEDKKERPSAEDEKDRAFAEDEKDRAFAEDEKDRAFGDPERDQRDTNSTANAGEANLVPRTSQDPQVLQVHVNRTEFKQQDMLVPWQLKTPRNRDHQAAAAAAASGDGREKQTFHRFYHVFRQGELEALCCEVAGCIIRRSYYDQGNWCVVLQKS
ncbi:tRNA (carboxymethyluridine(34)-5-O)-methyltransferase ALKBH8-like [Babylonia areolata]|uniref:tRNA (carboxymethyluridine(34)-5-O)-methyltransferase ALKBH8-like n=1 Tax=Babylonia areolata TaxID=304850 RepID=UPI003FCFE741